MATHYSAAKKIIREHQAQENWEKELKKYRREHSDTDKPSLANFFIVEAVIWSLVLLAVYTISSFVLNTVQGLFVA